MTAEEYRKHFEVQLNVLKTEINLFQDFDSLWECPKGISNSAGTLCLHLTGNLQYFIGAALGKTGYIRDRNAEFNKKDLKKAELITEIEAAAEAIKQGFELLQEKDLPEGYVEGFFNDGHLHSTDYILSRLLSHLNYHIGQVNYLRRILNS